MSNQTETLYAIEVGSTRTRHTLFFRVFRTRGGKLEDVTVGIAKAIGEPIQPNSKSIQWPAKQFAALAEKITKRHDAWPVKVELA